MDNKIGLVLSGGGAKGAYHVGVLQALQEYKMPIDMIAGASIGALNGAILASAPDIDTGISHMKDVWNVLPQKQPIQFGIGNVNIGFSPKQSLGYFTFLLSAGLRFSNPVGLATTLIPNVEIGSLLKDDVLQHMLQEYLDLERLQKSIPLYVSIFPQQHGGKAFNDFLLGIKDGIQTELLGINNQHSEFRHIQALPLEQQKELILASSALPLLFKAYENEKGLRFTDGGQGGMLKSQGNTPIQPLIEAGCKNIIVVHLDGESLWHRHDFPDTTVIEIRPSIDMGGFKAMLDFSEGNIQKLIQTGYNDAMQTLEKVHQSLSSVYAMRASTQQLNQVYDNSASHTLEDAMTKMRASK